MKPLIKGLTRLRFLLTRRERASAQCRQALAHYLELVQTMGADGKRPVRVPSMLGVDEDMRDWSLFMILEHNAIVNRSITAIVQNLARDEEPTGAGAIDMKTGVMPGPEPGEEQVAAFRESVEEHLAAAARLGKLRGTRRKRHSVFGMLDAHGWHCMFALHLQIHLRQAEVVAGGMS